MNLQNLQGWLRVYLVYLLIGMALYVLYLGQGLMQGAGLSFISTSLLGSGLLVFLAWTLTQAGKPWVRVLHIAINGITVAFLLANMTGLPALPFVGWIVVAPLSGLTYLILPYHLIQSMQLIISGINAAAAATWAGYWVMSARVSDIYLEPVPQAGAAPEAEPEKTQKMQETEQPEDGYISEEDAARGQAHQSAQAPRPQNHTGPVVQPGMSPVLKGCLIAFGLLLVAGLIFVVLVITTLESWFG